eukprot:11184167-Lingulodinium_polyedra.AAC.1
MVVDAAKVRSAFTDFPVEAYVPQAVGQRAQALQALAEGGGRILFGGHSATLTLFTNYVLPEDIPYRVESVSRRSHRIVQLIAK